MLLDDSLYPCEWHPQDWICVIEALCWMATDESISDRKSTYACQLADEIAMHEGLPVEDLLAQSDYQFIRGDL